MSMISVKRGATPLIRDTLTPFSRQVSHDDVSATNHLEHFGSLASTLGRAESFPLHSTDPII